jgi:proline iminopeptidase
MVMGSQAKSIRLWKRIAVRVLLALLVILIAFVAIANLAYYSPPPTNLPCRNCSGDARAVHVQGFDLYYRELGTDTTHAPIVVLHGGPGHSSQSFKHSLDFLAQTYRVVYYDQRGSGNSQIKPDATNYTVEHLVEELDTLRRDVIGADRIVVIGHSAGGALAQRYALAHSQHVESLVLVSSIQINNGVSTPVVWDVFGPAVFVLGAGFPPAEPAAANEWFAQVLLPSSLPRLYDPDTRSLIEDSGTISFATWREVSRSLEGADFSEDLRQLPVRTLVIYGVADAAYTGEANATALCTLLPDCTLARFERSGHWAFLEEPDRFAQEVMAFLAGR